MNREIKFRAWDKKDGIFIHQENEVTPIKSIYQLMDVLKFEEDQGHDIILMQFTGLKDKNGKEIYEGDIVATTAKTKSVVEFDKGLFGLNHDYGTDRKSMLGSWGSECNLRCLYDGYHREIEVIGNIYQNPELLKD